MWAMPPRTRMMGWRTNEPGAFFAAGQPQDVPVVPEEALSAPIIVSDFKNGVYTLNGAPAMFADLWRVDPALWQPTSNVIAGTGLTISNSANSSLRTGPLLTDAAFAALNPGASNMTFVIEYTVTVSGTGVAVAQMEANDSPAPTHGMGYYAQLGGTTFVGDQIYNYPDAPIPSQPLGAGFHRAAGLINFANLGICGQSKDGGAVVTGTNDDASTDVTILGVLVQANGGTGGSATATISKVALYPAQPLGELVALSA